ncbi:PREDICTED: uncharacterized protein LOC100639747 [Amphimedon queenslandica]|uniref:Uncharacterized protein n=1 Tax=Amphimedon queenslandica TaxID=400682 RepID=A0AAN0IHI9_AMPQE|nr:PREDICTED: uncharacterized protein LOC100639747 [Amphimedon queenslandica]|eukprot:XP_003388892.1 PREDICTED: uncharacterized protein LOC100639747 [Amphimedon queenslandica]
MADKEVSNISSPVAAAPEVYTTPPPQPKDKKPGQLSPEQVKQYFNDGFLVVPSFFTKEELKPVMDAIEECVDVLASNLYRGGKIKDKAESAGLYKRLILLEAQFPGAAVLLHRQRYLPVAFRNLWSNDRLLNVMEQLVGPNVAGHPVWNIRTKTPVNEETTVPWHQDNAYLDETCLTTLQPTAWIPLIDANMTNGCMQVVKGGHRAGKTATHTCCAGGTWYVDLAEEEIEKTLGVNMKTDVVTCEVPLGGVLFLNNTVPHRSLENFSENVRWSLDLRWQDPKKSNGFHGLRDCVLMRSVDSPNHVINWEGFGILDRKELEIDIEDQKDAFDTRIHGPWMKRWEITHSNRHTDAFLAGGDTWYSKTD